MYLYKKHYVGNKWKKPDEQLSITPAGGNGVGIKAERISEITEEVAYWRKANAIHKWFVDNVQGGKDDCGEYYVERKQLQELTDLCKTVIAGSILVDGKVQNGQRYEKGAWVPILEDGKTVENPTSAAILLPTTSGFFFGGTDYDQYYVDDLKGTVEMLEAVLAETEETHASFYYHSSW
jgi:hypothetical protein